MGKSGYTSLSIDEKRYTRMRKNFDVAVQPETDSTYTSWHCDVVESAIDRVKFLHASFPNLSLVKVVSNGIVIDDSKTDDVIKVSVHGKKIVCSDSKNPEKYIQFALLHPEFRV